MNHIYHLISLTSIMDNELPSTAEDPLSSCSLELSTGTLQPSEKPVPAPRSHTANTPVFNSRTSPLLRSVGLIQTLGADELVQAGDSEPISYAVHADDRMDSGESLALDSLLMSNTEGNKSDQPSPPNNGTGQRQEVPLVSLPEVAQLADSIADVKLENEGEYANRIPLDQQNPSLPQNNSFMRMPSFSEPIQLPSAVPVAPQLASGYTPPQTTFPPYLNTGQFPSRSSIVLPMPQSLSSRSLEKFGYGDADVFIDSRFESNSGQPHTRSTPIRRSSLTPSQEGFGLENARRPSEQEKAQYGPAEDQIHLSGVHRLSRPTSINADLASHPKSLTPDAGEKSLEEGVGLAPAINNDLSVPLDSGTASKIIAENSPGSLLQRCQRFQEGPIRRVQSACTPPRIPTPTPSIGRSRSFPSIADSQNNEAASELKAKNRFDRLIRRGLLNEKAQKYEDALSDYQEALSYELQFRSENHLEVANTYTKQARVCRKLSKFQEAIQYLEKALQICQECEQAVDSDILWNMHDELAQAYAPIDVQKEIENYERAIEILCMSTDVPPERLVHMHHNVGVSYHKLQREDKSKEHLLKAKEMMSVMLSDAVETAKVCRSLGDVYMSTREDDLAIAAFTECLGLYSRTKRKEFTKELCVSVHKSLSNIYSRKGDAVKAKHHKMEARKAKTEMAAPALQSITDDGSDGDSFNPLTRPSMFGEMVEEKIQAMSEEMKTAQADDYAEIGRKRRDTIPRLAQQYFESSFQIRSMIKADRNMTRDYIDAARAYMNDGQYQPALEYFNQAEQQPSVSQEEKEEIMLCKAQAARDRPYTETGVL